MILVVKYPNSLIREIINTINKAIQAKQDEQMMWQEKDKTQEEKLY